MQKEHKLAYLLSYRDPHTVKPIVAAKLYFKVAK
jgi:hypothetical protein